MGVALRGMANKTCQPNGGESVFLNGFQCLVIQFFYSATAIYRAVSTRNGLDSIVAQMADKNLVNNQSCFSLRMHFYYL